MFKRAYKNSEMHGEVSLFLFAPFMQESLKQDLLHRIKVDSDVHDSDGDLSCGTLCPYDEVVNYLLATYANESSISTADAAITDIEQHENQSPISFEDVVFAKKSGCWRMYG